MQHHGDQASVQASAHRLLVEEASEFIAIVGPDLTITFVNDAVERLVGRRREEVIGQSVTDLVHPDDLDRAFLAITGLDRWGSPNGATSFRLLHGDGTWRTFDITAARIRLDDGTPAFAVYGRPGDYQHALQQILTGLLAGADRSESLTPVLDVVEWRLNDVQVAIAWQEPDGRHAYVSTGLPRPLTGAEDEPGGPWAHVRATGREVHTEELPDLDAGRDAEAARLARGGVWVAPVTDAGSGVPALVTLWTRDGGPPPRGHVMGMTMARGYVELVLRWHHQEAVTKAAARTDPLTGLPNRREFFDALEAERGGGAVLFCDLDEFKPVNDTYGHNVGDAVLREVATRLREVAGAETLLARTGGDEFVVLIPGACPGDGTRVAAAIEDSMAAPFVTDEGPISVGITVGHAHTDGVVGEDTVAEADRALIRAKAAKRRH